MNKLAEMNEKLLAETRAELADKDGRIQELLEKLKETEGGIAALEAKSANAIRNASALAATNTGGAAGEDAEALA